MAKILVLGATGRVGSRVARELLEHGHEVHAATRDPIAAASRTPEPSPHWVRFDLEDPSSFSAALEGVERVLLVARPGDDHPERPAAPLIAAMKRAGVKHVVNLTALDVEQRPDFGLRRLELQLEDSGLGFTHLRPGFFFQLFTAPPLHARICRTRAIRAPADTAKLAFIDVRDVAAVAAKVLCSTEHRGRAYSLTGAKLIDHAEIARALSRHTQTPLSYQPISEAEAADELAADGLPPAWVARVLGFYRIVRSGQASIVSPDVRNILGREPIDVETFARDHAEHLHSS